MTKQIEVFHIDSSIPIQDRGKRGSETPLRVLKVGESFVFSMGMRASIQTIASRLKRETGKEFVVRKIDDGTCRVWRKK